MKPIPDLPKQTFMDFAAEYLRNGGNATQAYLTVINPDASYETAQSTGPRLKKAPVVRAILQQAKAVAIAEANIEASEVLSMLLAVVGWDIEEITDEDGRFLPVSEWPPYARKAVNGVKVTERLNRLGEVIGINTEYKMCDKLKAMELIGKHLEMFTEVQKHDVGGTLAEHVEMMRRRKAEREGFLD
jgi:phage terminase small subunit